MRLKGKSDTIINLAPNKGLFIRFMSHQCRDLLSGVIEYGNTKLQYFGQSTNNLMTAFGDRFNQITFEEICQTYDSEQYLNIIMGTPGNKKNPGVKAKDSNEVLAVISLDLLSDSNWINSHEIKKNDSKIGDISQYSELYDWVVDKFVTGDFTKYDVGKIIEMGRICSLDTIKKEAQQVQDPDKKNIAYLYAIIRSVSSKNNFLQERDAAITNANNAKLSELIKISTEAESKLPYKSDPNSLDKWQRDRDFIDVLRKLKDDDDLS